MTQADKWKDEMTLQEAKDYNVIQGNKLREFIYKDIDPNQLVDYLKISWFKTSNVEEDKIGFYREDCAIIKVRYTDEYYLFYYLELPLLLSCGGKIVTCRDRALGIGKKEDDRITFYSIADMGVDSTFLEDLGCEEIGLFAFTILRHINEHEEELCKKYNKKYIETNYVLLMCPLITVIRYYNHPKEFMSNLMLVKYNIENI